MAALMLAAALGGAVLAPAEARGAGEVFALHPVQRTADGYFRLDARPGATLTRAVRVRNLGRRAGTVELSAVDATTGATTGAVYRDTGAPRRDVGGWIELARTRVSLAPGASARVDFTVRVPSGARPGQHLGGIVARPVVPTARHRAQRARRSFRVQVVEQAIVAVQADVPGAAREHISIRGARAAGNPGYQTVEIGLRNDGDRLLKGSGTLVVERLDGTPLKRQSFTVDTFVPRTAVRMPVVVRGDALRAGRYRARIRLRYGRGLETRADAVFAVSSGALRQAFGGQATRLGAAPAKQAGPPPALIAGGVLAALLLAGLGSLAVRSRRRTAELRRRLELLEGQPIRVEDRRLPDPVREHETAGRR